MAHISRPFQVAFVAILVLACVWLFALQGHSNSTTSSSSAPAISVTHSSAAPAPASSATLAQREAAKAAAPTPIYHGPAPGVQGLTRAIAKAHEAVAVSQANANTLQQDSRRASGEAPAATSAPPASRAPASTSSSTSSSTRSTRPAVRTSTHPTTSSVLPSSKPSHSSSSSSTGIPAAQRAVEAELRSGEVAVILFWNPSGFDDQLVHAQVQRLASSAASKQLAVHDSLAAEISSYGSITRNVQVYATPTVLVVNPRGQVITISGMTDAYAIEQAIQEARSA